MIYTLLAALGSTDYLLKKKKKMYGVCEKKFLASATVIENFNTAERDVAFLLPLQPKVCGNKFRAGFLCRFRK